MKTQTTDETVSAPDNAQYQYNGDVNIENGGTFFDLSDWEHGYVNAVRVTDLDSGCGFDGAVLIEKITILIDDEKTNRSACECCGWALDELPITDIGKVQLAEAVMSYGRFDPANEYYEPQNEVIQTQEDGPMSFDGWKATKRVLSENLLGYIKSEYGV
jgi:hypothetical protein